MPNALTGDYEAVLQVAIRQINGVLGSLHQNEASEDAAIGVLHNATSRIGVPPPPPDSFLFGDWAILFQRASPGRGMRDIQAQLTGTAPPGAARMLGDAFARLYERWSPVTTPGVVRGTVKLQVASPTITVPAGSSSEVTVNAGIRAQYYPDADTVDLPAPIHGDVNAAFDVRMEPSGSGTRLHISPSSDDAKIRFSAAPGSGLSAADENTLAMQVRKLLREGLIVLPVDDFPFAAFKGLGSGSSQLIALPFQLTPGAGAPASGVGPITHSFIGTSGFALAVRPEYVSGRIDIEAIRRAVTSRSVTLTLSGPFGISVSVTYSLRFTSGPTLTFKAGGIEISARVAAETGRWWAPNGWIEFKQLLTLLLDPSSQTITPVRVGDPEVDESWFIPHATAVNAIRSQIDSALAAQTPSIRSAFTDAMGRLDDALNDFDPSAMVSFTGLEITPDGIIIRGNIGSGARRAPVVSIAEIHGGKAFTAFESWIPAGRIDRFIWSWVEHPGIGVWDGVERSFTDAHRFVFPRPADATNLSRICLRIEGTQTLLSGEEVGAAGGPTCHLLEPGFEIDAPSWWYPVMLPIWAPGLAETTVLRKAIRAHVSVQAGVPGKQPLPYNTLVYFADWRSQKPLEALGAALDHLRKGSALQVIVVLPAGAFDASRREVESRLASGSQRRVPMQFTEDDESGWTNMFAVGKKPSAYLVNARREFVWKHEGEPDPVKLAAAVDRHLVQTSPPGFRPLRLAIAPGDRAPGARFETVDREQFVLRRFRGRDVLLNFWQSWSAPCLTELGRLQRLHETGKKAPFIAAFHGGNNANALGEIRKRLGLSFALVQDSQQRIAQRYGVRCWPTTILIGADGRAEHVQFGIGHEHASPIQRSEPAVRQS